MIIDQIECEYCKEDFNKNVKKENQIKYGLSQEYINYLKLPKACNVKVYSVDKIVYAKKKLSTLEKINHLYRVRLL